ELGIGGEVAAGVGGAGGAAPSAPIRVLVWNTSRIFGIQSRTTAIPSFKAREATDNIQFDTTDAQTVTRPSGQLDSSYDASVFTDEGLDKYDVILFLNPTGDTFDDGMKDVRRAAFRDFIEKKARGFVGTLSATWAYLTPSWPWYVDFVGAEFS